MTLLEALVVMAVSVLLSALSFPAMERAAQAMERTNARVELLADLRDARARAIRQGRSVDVAISADGRRYSVEGVATALPGGLTLSARPAQVVSFHPDGSATGTLVALAAPDRATLLRIAPLTGLITPETAAQ